MILKVSPPYHPNNLTRLLLERLSGLGKSSQSLSSASEAFHTSFSISSHIPWEAPLAKRGKFSSSASSFLQTCFSTGSHDHSYLLLSTLDGQYFPADNLAISPHDHASQILLKTCYRFHDCLIKTQRNTSPLSKSTPGAEAQAMGTLQTALSCW